MSQPKDRPKGQSIVMEGYQCEQCELKYAVDRNAYRLRYCPACGTQNNYKDLVLNNNTSVEVTHERV